ncbi:DUF1574 domain-containing protein [Leptospira sp. 2 VSF19]|uniref:DUF1574 domain-containing protein n=1 Tax=Leptospira soteropolitanensis TaxID=2950025 RepID=A0AAW5VGA3_9LEPT|nr:DUF1574 domain-containing protein [Leptospira soteropolitanensis]MCW7492070.1 DUF1574 domain-containing protein [Leptospira soteropolitanensis]MCW7499652.1 DUF1574 domain-containing protein [Leptospira soteropolitanensis]MCW7521903.1 DUF1574 domain-containing protein [Leptospira soteropolitanensis]MCW7525757.1 DUF1574 domain-containing protein [Leptospira soteropolitanensis]MCW7530129.1 DUF1574 domain-containing protein [Leptospira soteropolitanensis]
MKLKYKFPVVIYPILLAACLFLLDKIFFLPIVVENTYSWKKIERKFYELKEDLFLVMLEERNKHPEKQIGLILGSSRSGEFDSEMLESFFPNTNSFNFAAPFGPPSFQAYWLERTLEAKLPIRYVLIEVDPLLFSQSAIDYSLNGSYDNEYVLKQIDFYRTKTKDPWLTQANGFSMDEAEVYFLKKLFALYKYPLDPTAIKANNKEIEVGFFPGMSVGITGKEHKRNYIDKIKLVNRVKFGALPNEIKFANMDVFLERDAEAMYNQYLRGTKLAPTQIYFFHKILDLLKGKDIPVIVYFPAVSDALRRRMKTDGLLDKFNSEIKKAVSRASEVPHSKFFVIDPNTDPRWVCKDFVDSLHLSGACFPNLLPILFPKEVR